MLRISKSPCISLLTTVTIWALASRVPAKAQELTPFEIAFVDGVWAFSQGDGPEAVVHFQKAVEIRPEDSFAHYMLGLSYLRVEQPQQAEKEIAASLKADPPPPVERSRILVDLGAAHLAAGNAQAAVDTLEEALRELESDAPVRPVALHHYATALAAVGRQADSDAAREQALALNSKLDPDDLPITTPRVSKEAGSGEGKRWFGSLSLAAEHDSNPNLLSEDLLLPLPAPGDEAVSGNSSDSALETDLQVSYGPARFAGGWSLWFDLRGGGSFHHELDYLDVGRARGGVRLGWERGRRWSLAFQSGVEQILLNDSSYLRLLDAGVSLFVSPTAADVTRLDVSFLGRHYTDNPLADPRRDGEEVFVGLHQIRHFGGQGGSISLGIAAADRSAEPEFERTLWRGDVEAALPVGSRWALGLFGWLTEEDFGDSASNLFNPRGPARDDRTWGASAELSCFLGRSKRVQALVRGTYTERDSNVDLGEGLPDLGYRRTIWRTGVIWTF